VVSRENGNKAAHYTPHNTTNSWKAADYKRLSLWKSIDQLI